MSEKSDKEDLGGGVTYTAEDIDGFTHQAELFLEEPEKLDEFFFRQVLIHIQILDHLALKPPGGRTGAQAVLTALKDFRELGDVILDAMHKRKEGKRGPEGASTQTTRRTPGKRAGRDKAATPIDRAGRLDRALATASVEPVHGQVRRPPGDLDKG